MLVAALGGLESLLKLGELRAGFGNEGCDVRLLGDILLDSDVQALFFLCELAGALAVAFELGERGFDFRLHRGDEVLAGVRLGAGGAEGGFQVRAGFAGGDGAFLEFIEFDFLLGDAAVELVERFVGGGEIEFLLGEFLAGRGDVGMVL